MDILKIEGLFIQTLIQQMFIVQGAVWGILVGSKATEPRWKPPQAYSQH